MIVSVGSPFLLWLVSPFLPLVIPCILLIAIKQLWYEFNIRKKDPTCSLPLPGGTMGWPIIGETPLMALQGARYYDKRFKEHGRLFKTHIFGRPTIRVLGADNLRKILMGEQDIVESNTPTSTNILLGPQSLTQSHGQSHSNMRKHVSAAFTREALSEYMPLMQRPIQEAISEWCKEDSVLAYPECRSLTFRVASKVLCGFDYGREEMQELTTAFQIITENLFSLPFALPGFGLYKGLKARQLIFDKIADSVTKVTEESESESDEDGRQKPSALRILMQEMEAEDGERPSVRRIQETIVDLLVAGFVSTASASTSLVLQLFKHPHVLKKVREELEAHGVDTPESPISFEKINELKYLSCVVKEALRMAPPVGGGFRKVLKTFEIDGKQIPKDWTLLYSIRDTMKFSELYTNSDKFDPERFSAERAEDRKGDRFNYCVFGGGSRSCVAKPFAMLKLKVLVAELARSSTWEVLNPEDLRFRLMPVPHPVNGMPVRFTKVQHADLNSNSVTTTTTSCCHENKSHTNEAAEDKRDLNGIVPTLVAA